MPPAPEVEILKNSLSTPESDHVTGSFELKVATTVWFSATDGVSLLTELTIIGWTSSISITVIVTKRELLVLPELSVAVTITLYWLSAPLSSGDSKSGEELNDSSPVFEILNKLLSVPDNDQVTASFEL